MYSHPICLHPFKAARCTSDDCTKKGQNKSGFLLMSACVCCDRIKTNDAKETLETVARDFKRRTGFKTSIAFVGCFWNAKYPFSAQFSTVPLLHMLF